MEGTTTFLSMDNISLQIIRNVVYANLSNEHFGAEELAKEIGLSRSQIYRKLSRINGKSITQFIREIRLEEALKLLNENSGTAAEISYQVGFSSPTYFNKCFHEYFGFPPGTIKKKNEIIQELNKSYLLDRYETHLTNLRKGIFSPTGDNEFISISDPDPKKYIRIKRSSKIIYLMIGLLILIIFLVIGSYFV